MGSDYPLKLNPEASAMFRPYSHSASGSPAASGGAGLLPAFFGGGGIHPPKSLKNHLDSIDRKMRNTSAGLPAASGGGGGGGGTGAGGTGSASLMPPWFLHQQPNKNKRRQLSESASG